MSTPIFNSLGSNYTSIFASKARSMLLFPPANQQPYLTKQLSTSTHPHVYLFYKARHAITFALTSARLPANSQVLTQAFTCWAVEEAILNANLKLAFVDTAPKSLNPTLDEFKQAFKKNPNTKAVIIQHTLGQPAEIKTIASWCKQKNLFLIEDLAHSVGAIDSDNQPVGTYADAVVYSFGRDKIIDAVSGGACALKYETKPPAPDSLPPVQQYQDLLYPTFTQLIRNHYSSGIGKILHFALTKITLLSSPIANPTPNLTALPSTHAALAIEAFARHPQTNKLRSQIANTYQQNLPKAIQLSIDVYNSSNLRFPILIKKRAKLISYLKANNFYLSDTWYKHPVETGKLKVNTSYQLNSCPNAEYLAKHLCNLPTHINITPQQAKQLSLLVNKFLTSQ